MVCYFYISVVFILIGTALVLYPKQVVVGFCRFGKLLWKIQTLGLTDMHWFYREDLAPSKPRLTGAGFLGLGLILFVVGWFSFHGPGSLDAMREAEEYLASQLGHSASYQFNVKESNSDDTAVLIHYRYGSNEGRLNGRWDGKKYIFQDLQ